MWSPYGCVTAGGAGGVSRTGLGSDSCSLRNACKELGRLVTQIDSAPHGATHLLRLL